MTIRIAVIGLGTIAEEFFAAIAASNEVELVAVCDLDERRRARWADAGIAAFASHRDLIAQADASAAIVALPNDQHPHVVGDLIDAGIHVSCEKPLTINPADARTLIDRAASRGVVLRTAFHRRFNSHLIALANRVRDRTRPVRRVRVRYYEDIAEHTGGEAWYLDKERCGGGCLVDNGPNAVDMARLIVGELDLSTAEIGDVRAGLEYVAHLDLLGAAGEQVSIELEWAYPHGELKDVLVEFEDGTTDSADMLEGFEAFKGSLAHEYRGILADFTAAIHGHAEQVNQLSIVQLIHEAVVQGRRRHTRLRMPSKTDVETRVVRLLFHETPDRGMMLAHRGSACIMRGEIHELVVTNENTDFAGGVVDRVGYLGFIEFRAGAMLTRGDTFWLDDMCLGEFAGFDESHMPNHLNLILHSPRIFTSEDIDLRAEDTIVVREGRQREFTRSEDPGAWSNQQGRSTVARP